MSFKNIILVSLFFALASCSQKDTSQTAKDAAMASDTSPTGDSMKMEETATDATMETEIETGLPVDSSMDASTDASSMETGSDAQDAPNVDSSQDAKDSD